MITCYFGVPRVGKTTLLAKFAVRELKKFVKVKVSIFMYILIFRVKDAKR